MFAKILAITLALFLASCGTTQSTRVPSGTTGTSRSNAADSTYSPTVARLVNEAKALALLTNSALGKQFLDATSSLPPIHPRTVWQNPQTREYFSPAAAAALPEAARIKLVQTELDEYRYYYTKYGSPLAYVRALDIASEHGFDNIAGKRILDFGYGSIGHLRLLASLGAQVTGVDPDSYLDALYSEQQDQGAVRAASGKFSFSRAGTVTLVHGHYPQDGEATGRVGNDYDLILSKNTLKRGYLKPERKIDKHLLVELGVSDEVFLKTLYNALNPGGKLLIYNLYPKAAAAHEKYKPFADGRSPFSREQYEKSGFRVIALNHEDHAAIRKIGLALKWDQNEKNEVVDNLETNLFAMFTLLEKPKL